MATRRFARQAARRRQRPTHQTASKPLYRRALRYEPLEDRRLLAIVTVDTLEDSVGLNDGHTSLREAIFATNLDDDPDTIEFAPALTAAGPSAILLTQGELAIADDLTITGPGAALLTIDATGSDRTPDMDDGRGSHVFYVDDHAPDALRNVMISGLTITGGD